MTDTSQNPIWAHPKQIIDLAMNKPTRFDLCPDAPMLAAIAADLDLLGLKKLRFKGELKPLGQRDWQLSGRIGASVVQPCVVTLDPVSSRIDEDVLRIYCAQLPEYEAGSEVEMSEDEYSEPLGPVIDLGAVMVEALALHLPQYPRSQGANHGEAVFSEPGKAPMKNEDARPFAGLKSLRDKLEKGGE